jgi:anti-sigma B factor antagonist
MPGWADGDGPRARPVQLSKVELDPFRWECIVDVRLSVRPGRACSVVEVAGDLDVATSPQLRQGLQQVLDAGTRHVVVDLAGVGFMDSSALGTLVVMFKAFREGGGRLCLAAAQPPVLNILSVTSVDRAIDVYDSVPDAEASTFPTAD